MKGSGPFALVPPRGRVSAIVADCPHAGTVYPVDFGFACAPEVLRRAEDTGADALFAFLPDLGAAFLQARIARSYIDLNRADTVSAAFHADPGGVYAPPDFGLIRGLATRGGREPVYARPVPLAEAFARVACVWAPYHARLAGLLEHARADNGRALLLDVHSMPSAFSGPPGAAPEIAIGTRAGRSAGAGLAAALARAFEKRGFSVAIDAPGYQGGEILRRHGDPQAGVHALQIEVRRDLYLDERTLAPNRRAPRTARALRAALTEFRRREG